jgi:hypothetical protein
MQNPAERLSDENLEEQLVDHVVEELARGNKEGVAHWIPDVHQQDKRQLSNTLTASLQVLQLADANAKRVCSYLLAVIGGFLQDFSERSYLKPLRDSDEPSVVEFPAYTLDETTECVTRLVDRRAASHERRFRELIDTHMAQPEYAAMWEAVGINASYGEGPAVRKCDFTSVLPRVWGACPDMPKSFEDREFVQGQGRKSALSLHLHLARQTGHKGSYFDLEADRVAAFAAVTTDLERQQAAVTDQLQQMDTPEGVQAQLDQALAGFNTAADATEAAIATAMSAYSKCYHWCNKVAELEAERDFLSQIISMHSFQQLSPLQKLTQFMSDARDPARLIPCSQVVELRYHVEFLLENLVAYCTQECVNPLVRASALSDHGEVANLNEQQKARQGRDIGEYIEQMLQPLLARVRSIDYAEANRAEVEVELRSLVPKIDAKQQEFDRAIDECGERYMAARKANTLIELQRIAESRSRLNKLIELAPAGPRPESIRGADQLVALYQGSDVTEAKLRELLAVGLSKDSHLLQQVAQHSEWPERLSLAAHFLARGALVDYREAGVQTLARAYGAAVGNAEANGLRIQDADMRFMAVLEGGKRLFRHAAADRMSWLSRTSRAVFGVVSTKTGIAVERYEQKYGVLVNNLLRQLLLSLYFENVNERAIQASPFFQDLCRLWGYLSSPLQTVQLFLGERHSFSVGELNTLKKSLLGVVKSAFRDIVYNDAMTLRDRMIHQDYHAELALPTLLRRMEERGVDMAPTYQEELSTERADQRVEAAQALAEQQGQGREALVARVSEMEALLHHQQHLLSLLMSQVAGGPAMMQILGAMQRQLPGAQQPAQGVLAPRRGLLLLDAPQRVAVVAGSGGAAAAPALVAEAEDVLVEVMQAEVRDGQVQTAHAERSQERQGRQGLRQAVVVPEAAAAAGEQPAAPAANDPRVLAQSASGAAGAGEDAVPEHERNQQAGGSQL